MPIQTAATNALQSSTNLIGASLVQKLQDYQLAANYPFFLFFLFGAGCKELSRFLIHFFRHCAESAILDAETRTARERGEHGDTQGETNNVRSVAVLPLRVQNSYQVSSSSYQ
jgi:hypothetical protein